MSSGEVVTGYTTRPNETAEVIAAAAFHALGGFRRRPIEPVFNLLHADRTARGGFPTSRTDLAAREPTAHG